MRENSENYRFKLPPNAQDPDALTGKHIPDTLRRALEWSAKRHDLAE